MSAFSLRKAERTKQNAPRLLTCLAAALSLLLASAVVTFAQGVRGNISGEVTDPNGAVVSGATVKLIRTNTQQEIRTVQSNDEGVYQFLQIEPQTYDIVVSASGFAEARLKDVTVEPNRSLRLDTKLNLTGTTEEVTVTATQELVDRESPTLGTTVDPRRVIGLPLNGRNVLDLVLLQPGVTNSNNNQPAGTFGGGSGFRVNGQRGVENNVTLDGANNNEVAVGGLTGAQPRPDAVQEFRVLTSNFEAEFGRNTGSIVNIVTKSGTNDFHGNLRTFYRPTFLSSARFFDQDSRTDPALKNVGRCPADLALRTRENCDRRRPFERKEFGGQLGGPITLPRFGEGGNAVYSGRNRAYFFFDYEGRRQLIGDTRSITGLPTQNERNGIFTARLDPTTRIPILLNDPSTGGPFPVISGTPGVAGSTVLQQIPVARFSPIARYYLGFLPIPDATGTASAGSSEITNNNYYTSRVDYMATSNQTFNITLTRFDSNVSAPFAFGGASVPGFGASNLDTTYNAVVRHTYTITPTIVNSLLLGYARNDQPGVVPQNLTTPEEIGFQNTSFVANRTFVGPPRITLTQRGLILGNTIQGPQARVTSNFQIQDSLSWAVGEHRFKFGADGTKYLHDQTFLFVNQGIFGFSRVTGPNTTGDDFADFLIGNTPASQQYGANGLRDFRQFAMAAFAQDNWRWSDSLTLSLGVRWEFTGPLYDKFNRVAFYRPGVTSQILANGQLRTFEGLPITVPAGRRAPNGLVYVGDPDPIRGGTVPRGGTENEYNNFAPRLGFAYSPRTGSDSFLRTLLGENDTVIRGGFGVYYGAVIGDTQLQQLNAPGFNGTNSFFGSGGAALSSGTLANPFAPDPFPNYRGITGAPLNVPAVPNPFEQSQLFISAPLGAFQGFVIDPDIRTPYTYQYNLTLERGFLRNYVGSLSYVGNRGRKLYGLREVNPALGTFLPARAGDPVPTTTNLAARRANLDVPLSISYLVSDGNSWYNALEANLQRRFSDGLQFQIAYTFSKSMNDVDTQRGNLDIIDQRFGRALSSDDVPHRFVASFIYDLPFSRFLGNGARRLIGGWSIGGIYAYQSGTPFSVNNPNDALGTGGIVNFADLGEPFQLLDPRENNGRAFNANAFRAYGDPATGFVLARDFRRGTSGRNQFRAGNTINNLDLILAKRTELWSESTNLELRFEAFNALNRTQFTTLETVITNAAFGRYTNTRESRVIQLGARFSF
ncbi:MAG TPA: TonB-dependent receptor [Pyrinomonadaceae bacterium]|jgi:hypothetical protein